MLIPGVLLSAAFIPAPRRTRDPSGYFWQSVSGVFPILVFIDVLSGGLPRDKTKYIHKPQSERETRMLRDAEVTKRFIFSIASYIVGVDSGKGLLVYILLNAKG